MKQGCEHKSWKKCRQCQHEEKCSIWLHKESLCLVVIQFQFVFVTSRSFMSEIHVCMVKTVACIWSGHESSSCVSSAKDGMETEWISVKKENIPSEEMKRVGPKTEPCGTPKKTVVGLKRNTFAGLVYLLWSCFERVSTGASTPSISKSIGHRKGNTLPSMFSLKERVFFFLLAVSFLVSF